MNQLPELINHLNTNQLRIGFEVALSLLCVLGSAAITFIFKKSREFFSGMDAKLDAIKDNHLTHIETYTGKTAETVEKLLAAQNESNLRQAEMNAFLKAKME